MSEEINLDRLGAAVDDVCTARSHLSQWAGLRPAEMAHECSRALYHSFRWTTEPQPFPPHVTRIMGRGQREEEKIVDDLKATGLTISDKDAAGKQWSVSLLSGHSTGNLDGAGHDPHQLYVPTPDWFLVEAKTHNERSFERLVKGGVQRAFPKHYGQQQIYMHLTGLKMSLYAARCKNDERDCFKLIKYNESYATRIIRKGELIVFGEAPPERISNDPTLYACRFCNHKDVCHGKTLPLRNCRTCLYSKPVDGGKWWCDMHGRELSRKDQRAGCERHRWIPGLIAGTPIETGGLFNRYRMPNGTVLTDSGPTK